MDDDALVDLFSLFLAPNRLQRLSSTSAQLVPALALSSKPFTKLLHLEIPASSLHEPSFVAALSLCPSIRRLDIQTERAVSSGSRLHTSIPTTLPPSVLPNLSIYRGPRNYASLFCYRPESDARVHTVELTSLSSAPRLFQTFRSLPSKLENLVIRIDGEVPKTLFSTIHQRFPTLRSLSVNDPVLSFGPLKEILHECAEEGTILPSLRSLRVRVMGKERYNLWVPPAAEANDVIQMFGKLRGDVGSVYPGLTSLKFVHGIENSTVVWRATYPGNELALSSHNFLSPATMSESAVTTAEQEQVAECSPTVTGYPPPCTPRKRRPSRGVRSPYFSPPRRSLSPSPKEHKRSRYFPNNSPRDTLPQDAPFIGNLSDIRSTLKPLKPLLIQETVRDDPWKVLIAVTLLNKTAGALAIPVFWKLVEQWPTPFALSQGAFHIRPPLSTTLTDLAADEPFLVSLLTPLGTQNRRAARLIALSRNYLLDPPSPHDVRRSRASGPLLSPRKREKYPDTPISHLPGAGAYALDSYRIFCASAGEDEWRNVQPADKELRKYLRWRWAFELGRRWDPVVGDLGPVDEEYVEWLVKELESLICGNAGLDSRASLRVVHLLFSPAQRRRFSSLRPLRRSTHLKMTRQGSSGGRLPDRRQPSSRIELGTSASRLATEPNSSILAPAAAKLGPESGSWGEETSTGEVDGRSTSYARLFAVWGSAGVKDFVDGEREAWNETQRFSEAGSLAKSGAAHDRRM
uniref:DNA glycosylase n=1 Tax=Mycena chlorophos TaxID=658473 RepID=A0ABQ0LJM0_MYCCL|nr:predicted protein [Mycena chlorophos]